MAKQDPERARRLAESLRANLHRRKGQSREQADERTQRHADEEREADA